jgi:hypothetical protein
VWFPVQVSEGIARVPVLPRRVAAGVSVFAVTRTAHAIAGGVILVSIAGILVVFDRNHLLGSVALPLVALGVMLVALLVATLRTSRISLVAFILVGGLADYAFLYSVLNHHTGLLPAALVVVNRPATVIILVGTPGSRPLPAVAWGIAGFLVGVAATVAVDLQLGIPIQLGNGPAITLANYCAVFLGLSIVQRTQRRRVPDFLQMRHETRRIEAERTTEQRTVALMHDTVLNDLALIINGPDVLDARMRVRMTVDIGTLANTNLLDPEESKVIVDPSDGSLRNQMTQLISDFQWRGLNVEFTGDTGTVAHMTQDAVTAAVGALRACLENVLSHSGVDAAEIVVSATESYITWTVSDAGTGFDLSDVPADRLGLKSSVFGRVESEGGTVKVWTAPGQGTSVLFTLPLLAGGDTGEQNA